jgi:hypothetical protein
VTRHIEARFEIASWAETPFEDSDENAKLTEAPRGSSAPTRPARSRSISTASELLRREAAGGHRTPPLRRDADQALALVDHRLAVLRPVGMLTRDGPVVVDQRLDGVGQSITSPSPST